MAETLAPPVEEDIRHDDLEFNPAIEPRKSKAWLNLLQESEKAFEDYNDHCDKIDERLASLKRLSDNLRDKQFQLFWANTEVLKPAIYAKAPVPVVVPKFKDRRPVYDAASELLERCAIVAFDLAYINEIMLQARDDLAIASRGVAWCRYESKRPGGGYYDTERVCIDFKHRRDFLHSISRCWYEVGWVAAASYLTRDEARARFYKYSGDCYQDAEYKVDKDSQEIGGADARERAKFWEIWHKTERRVVWVAQGCEDILDEDDPHLELSGFFPCPKPAYGTCQRGSLLPVPDVLQYKDQLDEVDLLTSKIHALSDALEAKGFYPAGTTEIADAVQAAVATHTPGRVLVPISNWAAFGSTKEVIIWMPIEEIAQVITTLIATRKQVIEDVYQIMGLSDIMRGATDARETLGAQQLKTEYGSSRVRDKQYELARLAKDLVTITSEIITQKFDPVTMIEMSQTQLPTQDEQKAKVVALTQQLQQQQLTITQSAQSPQGQQLQQQDPNQAQQQLQQAQGQLAQGQQMIEDIKAAPTIEQVLAFLRDNRARSFTLDIETDSTVVADETAEKQRRTEFIGMLAPMLGQISQLIAMAPQTAGFCGEVLKFACAPFRTSRNLGGAIDDLTDQMQQLSMQGQKQDPNASTNQTTLQVEQMKSQQQGEKDKADAQLKMMELQMKDQHEKMKLASIERLKVMELNARRQDDAAKAQATNQKAMLDRENHQAEMLGKMTDMRIAEQSAQQKMQLAQATAAAHERRSQFDMQRRQMTPPGPLGR